MLYCYFNSRYFGKNRILDIFCKYNIAFAGFTKEEANNYKDKFKAGTKIAVTDGMMVKAVGIAEEDFDSLDNLKIDFLPEEKKRFDINKGVLAVKVKLYKLEEEDCYQEKSFRRRFSNINDDNIKKEIDERLKKYSGEEAMEKMKEQIKELLIQNKNLILTGAPGTGKTYLAKQIANEIGKYKFVQFHPSYDYTDFVEGLRPIQNEKGDIIFERKDGVFKEFCKEALNNQSSNFVFIVDEINRGEISKIFGELFFSVDSGYRGEKGKVLTQYANLIEDGDEFKDGFYIPENVFVIGTMNDIDRSVESMDFAMRRRFAWKEIKAEDTQETILNDLGDLKYETIRRMDNLNNAIKEKAELSEAYYIGAAYFKKIKDKDYNGDFDKLWNIHLKMLLFEYTRGMANQEEIMKNLKDAYNSNSDNDTEGEEEIIDEE